MCAILRSHPLEEEFPFDTVLLAYHKRQIVHMGEDYPGAWGDGVVHSLGVCVV